MASQVKHDLELVARGQRSILLGPCLGEVGFELLYWIPFLRWFAERYGVSPERLIAVSRGGASAWYAGFVGRSHDALTFMSQEEFRRKNDERISAQRGVLKHIYVSPFDQEIVDRVTSKRGLHGAKLLHPSEMYRLFEYFWFQRAPVTLIESFTSFSTIAPAGPWP